jgi:hypothetical protein
VLRGGFGLGALALGGTVLGGTVLSACGDDGGQTSEAAGNLPQNALLAAFPQGVPHAASGVATRLPYLLADKEGVPLSTIDGPVTFRVEMDGTQIGDEVEVEPRDDGVPRAYLPLTFTFPRTGVYDVFATYDGAELDSSIQIYDRADIGPPVVGAPLPAAPTPTTELGLAVNPICTRVPQCPFHAVDLQAAVGQRNLLQPGACDGVLRGLIEEHKALGVLERELRGVERRKRARLGRAARAKGESGGGDEQAKRLRVHRTVRGGVG